MAATTPTAKVANSKAGGRYQLVDAEGRRACHAKRIPLITKTPTAMGAVRRDAKPSKLTDIHNVRTTTIAPTKSCVGTNQRSGQATGSFGKRSEVRNLSHPGSHRAKRAVNKM